MHKRWCTGIAAGWLMAAAATARAATPAVEVQDVLGRKLGAVTAGIVRLNTAADRMGLLARVEAQPNEIVEFYEPSPGRILISGAGRPEAVSSLAAQIRSLTPELAWSIASGGQPLPGALQAAVTRSRARIPRSGGAASVRAPRAETNAGGVLPQYVGGGEIPRSPGWCEQYFHDSIYGTCGDDGLGIGFDFRRCFRGRTAATSVSHHDIDEAMASICPTLGTTFFSVWVDDTIYNYDNTWTVPQDTLRWWHYADSSCFIPGDDCPTVGIAGRGRWGLPPYPPVRFHMTFKGVTE